MTVGNSSPGQSSLRDTQHDLKHCFIFFSVEGERGDEMVRVQFSNTFDRGDEFWIIFKRQPALIDDIHIGSSGGEPCVFVLRKRAIPAVGEIKDRHVKNEHGVVPASASPKEGAQLGPEIVFTLFCFHCDFRMSETLSGRRPVTTKQSWDLLLPLSGEDVRVARRGRLLNWGER